MGVLVKSIEFVTLFTHQIERESLEKSSRGRGSTLQGEPYEMRYH